MEIHSHTAPRYEAVLFDIDDTILKTREPKWRQHKWVASHYYGVRLTDKELRAHWGKPFDELAAVLYQNGGTADERRANFIRHELEFPKTYEPYALETIEAFHHAGLALGLMTAMFIDGAKIDLEHLEAPLDYFAVLQGSEASDYHKPDGRVFEPALAAFNEQGIASKVAYVGEALSDYAAAAAAGLDFIAVTLGMVNKSDFRTAGAEHVFDNLREVKNFILRR